MDHLRRAIKSHQPQTIPTREIQFFNEVPRRTPRGAATSSSGLSPARLLPRSTPKQSVMGGHSL
jgi:hypothetical protein